MGARASLRSSRCGPSGLIYVSRVWYRETVVGQTALKALLHDKHMQDHSAFCREFGRIARSIDPALTNAQPSKATFYRWLAGDLLRLPRPGACRVLERMFPGWNAVDLFKQWESFEAPQPPPQTQVTEAAQESNVLSTIRSSLPIDTVAGYWVTGYEFTEFGNALCHVDISCVRTPTTTISLGHFIWRSCPAKM
jgi:hypothetical protein